MLATLRVDVRPGRVWHGRSALGAACKRWLIGVSLGLLIAIVLAAGAAVYVSSERTHYYWDYAACHDAAVARAAALREAGLRSPLGVLDAARALYLSTGADYNELPILPIIPFVLVFGDARLVYVLSVALVYLLPFVLVVATLAARLVPSAPRAAYWSAVAVVLGLPSVWLPTLRGYPDTGSAALIGLAALVYLHDVSLSRRWQIGAIGLLVALAVLLRPHFFGTGCALYAAMGGLTVINAASRLRSNPHRALASLYRLGSRIVLVAGLTVAALVVLGWPLVERVLRAGFGTPYASYAMPPLTNLAYCGSCYGWLVLVLAPLGLILGVRTRALARPVALLVLLLGSFALLQWVLLVRRPGIDLSLHLTPWVVLGLVGFVWVVAWALGRAGRLLLPGASGAFLALNLALGLAVTDPVAALPPAGRMVRDLFPAHFAPLRDENYDAIARLADYLCDRASRGDPIYVAAASRAINGDLLRHAAAGVGHGCILNVLQVPFADSRDAYPLEPMLEAQFVVVATPFQHHLPPEEQDVVRVVHDAFEQRWDFAADFDALGDPFDLSGGVVVKVYRRTRPTDLPTAIRTLEAMRARVLPRPGGQPAWISLNGGLGSRVSRGRDGSYRCDAVFDPAPPALTYLYVDALWDLSLVRGQLVTSSDTCGGLAVKLDALDVEGRSLHTVQAVYNLGEPPVFSLTFPTHGASYLLLTQSGLGQTGAGGQPCRVGVRNLEVYP